jgi:predicted permease
MTEHDNTHEQQINALLDGELDDTAVEALRLDASEDQELARAIIDAYQLQRAMEHTGVEHVPASLRKRLRRIPREQRPAWQQPRWIMATAAVPLVLLTVGDEQALPYFILLSLHALSIFTVTTVLLETSRHRDASLQKMIGKVFLGLLKNPILLGIAGGIVLNRLHMPLSGALDTAVAYLQNSVAACSLFALGAAMTKYGFVGQLKQSLVVVVAKNLALPVMVYISCHSVFALSAHWTFIAVLMASQPTGINAYLFAERYNTAQALATTSVFLSISFSLLSIPVLIYLYQSVFFQ